MYEPTLEDHAANLKSPDPDVRRNSAWLLGRMRDERIIPPLIGALNDEDTTVRVRAAEALGNFKDSRAVQPLLDLLGHETDDEVKTRIIASLGRQGDPLAFPEIMRRLQGESVQVQIAAVEALANLPDPLVPATLATVLTTTPDPDVRYQASRGLIQIGSVEVVDAILARLGHSHWDGAPAIAMLELLGQLRDPRAAEVVRQYVDHTDAEIAETAQWALKQLGA